MSNFDHLYYQLVRTRSILEDLRENDGPLGDRAQALNRLHGLRAEIAAARELS